MALRWLVLLVAVAAVVDLSQALYSTFKQQREKNFKRYLDGVRKEQSALKKRQLGDDYEYCPLWDCYGWGDYDNYDYGSASARSEESGDYEDEVMMFVESYREAQKCMIEMGKKGELCSCSLDDLYWSGMWDKIPENSNDTSCWECLGKLPDMFNPDNLHFNCEAGAKIDEAEQCFNGVTDKSCMEKAMEGVEMDPKTVFDGIRTEVAGCPIHDVVMDCMGFNDANYRDPYTSCLMGSTMEDYAGDCVEEWLQKLPICKDVVPADVLPQISASIKQGGERMCAPFKPAIEMKQKCCAGKPEAAPTARKLAHLLKMLEKKGF